eukprot:2506409-Rhodomonas_salina.2
MSYRNAISATDIPAARIGHADGRNDGGGLARELPTSAVPWRCELPLLSYAVPCPTRSLCMSILTGTLVLFQLVPHASSKPSDCYAPANAKHSERWKSAEVGRCGTRQGRERVRSLSARSFDRHVLCRTGAETNARVRFPRSNCTGKLVDSAV